MTGEIRSIDGRGCRGWAILPDVPDYPVMVHLVVDDVVQASAIADQEYDEGSDLLDEKGWFTLDIPEDLLDRRNDFRVLVGESGEYLDDRTSATLYGSKTKTELSFERSKRQASSVATYRDALAWGLDISDILDLFYLDILRRPIDAGGLAINLMELDEGKTSLEQIRKNLLYSHESRRLRLRKNNAPGRTFANPLVIRSSSTKKQFERHMGAFQRSLEPMAERLLRFFPGLLLRPTVLDRIEDDAVRGLPTREVFCRALSRLSDKPALILPDLPEVLRRHEWALLDDGGRQLTVPASSKLFSLGWHRSENGTAGEFRWMKQIGIILNPCPERVVERIDVCVNGWFGGLDQSLAVASQRDRLAMSRHQLEDGSWVLSITGGAAGNTLDYVVLVAVDATCPYRENGTPDPRLLSLNVKQVIFSFDEGVV